MIKHSSRRWERGLSRPPLRLREIEAQDHDPPAARPPVLLPSSARRKDRRRKTSRRAGDAAAVTRTYRMKPPTRPLRYACLGERCPPRCPDMITSRAAAGFLCRVLLPPGRQLGSEQDSGQIWGSASFRNSCCLLNGQVSLRPPSRCLGRGAMNRMPPAPEERANRV